LPREIDSVASVVGSGCSGSALGVSWYSRTNYTWIESIYCDVREPLLTGRRCVLQGPQIMCDVWDSH